MDPSKVRAKRDWISVLDDQRKEKTSSGIFLPGHETGIEKVTEGTGTLIRVGNGDKNKVLGLKTGDRIVYRGFLKHANRIETEEKWADGTSKHYFLMSTDDVLAIIEGKVEVGVFSGRPATGEVKITWPIQIQS